jgi:hypothetical protein
MAPNILVKNETLLEISVMEVIYHSLVACAELIHSYIPKVIDLHNYSPANSTTQKLYNWNTLNCNIMITR